MQIIINPKIKIIEIVENNKLVVCKKINTNCKKIKIEDENHDHFLLKQT